MPRTFPDETIHGYTLERLLDLTAGLERGVLLTNSISVSRLQKDDHEVANPHTL